MWWLQGACVGYKGPVCEQVRRCDQVTRDTAPRNLWEYTLTARESRAGRSPSHLALVWSGAWCESCISGESSYVRTGRPPPIDQNLPLVVAARCSLPETVGQFSFKSLTFGDFFVWKWTKIFQLQGGSSLTSPIRPYCPDPH